MNDVQVSKGQKLKKNIKRWLGVCMAIMVATCSSVCAFAADGVGGSGGIETSTVSYSSFSSLIDIIQGQISVSSIIGILAGILGSCVALVFMWWGLRKVVAMLMAAFRKGKMRV